MIIFELGQLSLEQAKHVLVAFGFETGQFQVVYDQPLAIDTVAPFLNVSLREFQQISTRQH